MRLRKVGAVLSGALMMGATLAGAVAAQDVQVVGNVAGFPFVTDGAITSEIVVGSGAPAADVASAADIAAKIGSMAVKPAELVPTPEDDAVTLHISSKADTDKIYATDNSTINQILDAYADGDYPQYLNVMITNDDGLLADECDDVIDDTSWGVYDTDYGTGSTWNGAEITCPPSLNTLDVNKDVDDCHEEDTDYEEFIYIRAENDNGDTMEFSKNGLQYYTAVYNGGDATDHPEGIDEWDAKHDEYMILLGEKYYVWSTSADDYYYKKIKVGKEVFWGWMSIGEEKAVGDYVVKLAGVSEDAGYGGMGAAEIEIIKDGVVVDKDVLDWPCDHREGLQYGDIYVEPTDLFVGDCAEACQAKIRIVTNLMTLENGKDFPLDDDFRVYLDPTKFDLASFDGTPDGAHYNLSANCDNLFPWHTESSNILTISLRHNLDDYDVDEGAEVDWLNGYFTIVRDDDDENDNALGLDDNEDEWEWWVRMIIEKDVTLGKPGNTIDLPSSESVANVEMEVREIDEGEIKGVDIVTKVGVTAPITKLDKDVTATDKAQYNLVCVGGPAVNSVVKEIEDQLSIPITATSPGPGKGAVQVVVDPWGTGKDALVVAGSDREGTRAAALQLFQMLA